MTRPAYTICLCPDSRLLQTRLDSLLATHSPLKDAWQRHVFWADEGLGPAFWEHLTLQGLFAVPKALVIRRAETLPSEILNKQLSPALVPLAGVKGRALPSPLVWPIVCLEVAFDKGAAKVPAHVQRLPAYKLAAERGWLDETPPLAGKRLSLFIRAEAERRDLVLRDTELAVLTAACPPDAAAIASEIAKLALLAGPDKRLPEGLPLDAGAAQELTIFELMRLVQQNRNAPAAWRQILEDRLSGDAMIFGFVAILLREARILWQSLCGGAPALPAQAAMQKKIAAQSLGLAGIGRLWDLALQADKGIKSGERGPEQAFEMLAAELFLLFGGKNYR